MSGNIVDLDPSIHHRLRMIEDAIRSTGVAIWMLFFALVSIVAMMLWRLVL